MYQYKETHFQIVEQRLEARRFILGKLYMLTVSLKFNDLSDFLAKSRNIAELEDSDYKDYAKIQQDVEECEAVVKN